MNDKFKKLAVYGIQDEELLESALAQPQKTFGRQFLQASIYEQRRLTCIISS